LLTLPLLQVNDKIYTSGATGHAAVMELDRVRPDLPIFAEATPKRTDLVASRRRLFEVSSTHCPAIGAPKIPFWMQGIPKTSGSEVSSSPPRTSPLANNFFLISGICFAGVRLT
jgi:hypothetical protein